MAFEARDDRDQPISVLRPNDVRRAADAEDPARAHLAVHLRNAIRVESQRFSLYRLGWAITACVIWLVVQIIVWKAGLNRYPGVRLGVFFGGIVILVLIGREITRRRISRMVAATAVAEGICGQCCYSLASVPVDADGRITCPECGAAWAHERITRPHWLVETFAPTFHDDPVPFVARLGRAFLRFLTSTPKPSNLIAADDRGRFIRTVDSRFYLIPRSRRVELTFDRIASLRRQTRRKGRELRFLLCLPTAVVAGALFYGAARLVQDHEVAESAIVAAVGLFFATVTVAINFSHGFLPPGHTARVLVADGLCGCCAAPFAGIPADHDGCATCPKCGAAWRIAPQTQP